MPMQGESYSLVVECEVVTDEKVEAENNTATSYFNYYGKTYRAKRENGTTSNEGMPNADGLPSNTVTLSLNGDAPESSVLNLAERNQDFYFTISKVVPANATKILFTDEIDDFLKVVEGYKTVNGVRMLDGVKVFDTVNGSLVELPREHKGVRDG